MKASTTTPPCEHAVPIASQVAATLALAEKRCKEIGLRLTDRRRDVLGILLRENRALGAYEILEHLRSDAEVPASPIIAYRALDFLTENGFAHKIERLSAYVACVGHDEDHSPLFMICRCCHQVSESHNDPMNRTLSTVAEDTGFRVERTMIEVEGLCVHCVDHSAG